MAPVRLNGQYGYIDTAGQWLIEPAFQLALPFTGPAAVVIQDQKWGLVNHQGRLLIPPRHAWQEGEIPVHYYEDRAAVRIGNRYGFIDDQGEWIVPPRYEWVGDFSEGLAAVRSQGKYGYIDRQGAEVLPCLWEDAGLFSGGLAPARIQGRWGYIDATGSWRIAPTFIDADVFVHGLARTIAEDGRWQYMNEDGAVVWQG